MANNQNTPLRNVTGPGSRVTGPEQDERVTPRPNSGTGAGPIEGRPATGAAETLTPGSVDSDGRRVPLDGSVNPNYPEQGRPTERAADGGLVKPAVETTQARHVGLYWVLAIGLVLVVVGFLLSYLGTRPSLT